MNRSSKILTLFLVIACLWVSGCWEEDPTQEQLAKGQNIDIERMEGRVTSKSVKNFKGDREHTKARMWKPYYCISVYHEGATSMASSTEEFLDVPVEVFDAVYIGKELPTTPLLSLTQLSKMEGEVADMQADLITGTFSIVVSNLEGIHIYRVDIKTYYTLVRIGSKLPLQIDPRDVNLK